MGAGEGRAKLIRVLVQARLSDALLRKYKQAEVAQEKRRQKEAGREGDEVQWQGAGARGGSG